ncbi:MAG: NAD(P)H-hydrate epimerase [Planctomycetota bacterium]
MPDRLRSHEPVYEMDVERVRALDRAAETEFGLPGIVLMENAALGVLSAASDLLASEEPTVTVVCGRGNNGGDGLALARHLVNRGVRVCVGMAVDPGSLQGDAAINMDVIRRMADHEPSLRIEPCSRLTEAAPDLIVDALFGTGLSRAVEGPCAEAVRWILARKQGGSHVLAIDVPSGLDADTGRPTGSACVRADTTVTLAAIKPGLTRLEAQPYVGEIRVAGIGVPRSLLARFGSLRTPPRGSDGPGPRADERSEDAGPA